MFVVILLNFCHFVGLLVALICACDFCLLCINVLVCLCTTGVWFWLFVICYLFGWWLTVGVVLFEFNSVGLFLDAGLGFAVFDYLWFAC